MQNAEKTIPPGTRSGKLEVICLDTGRKHDRNRYYLCRCDCGGGASIRADRLRSGETKRCGGCLTKRKPKRAVAARATTKYPPGLAPKDYPREYNVWRGMRARCSNPKNLKFAYYGGRGISVCERWQASFVNFMLDMGERPEGTSLDRIDNDGNYEPGNCRWTTQLEQIRNSRVSRSIQIGERTYPSIREAARVLGVNADTLSDRIKRGADPTTVGHRCRAVAINGVSYPSIKAASIELGIPYSSLYRLVA